jgi:thioredoxin-related protein
MKKIILLFCGLLSFMIADAQEQKSAAIKWMSFEEAVEKSKVTPRKMFIDVYTKWCGWCKRMDATTFTDSAVVKYMNENFYAVKLDAERKDTVQFFEKTFVYRAENKANDLAIALLNGQMSYPSFVFLDEKFGMLSPLAGYQQVDELMNVLLYFGDNIYQTKKWEDYSKKPSATPAEPAK